MKKYLSSERAISPASAAVFGAELLEAEMDPDHICLLMSITLTTAPAVLIRVLKTQTSSEIHQAARIDGHVEKIYFGNAPLWQPSYFIAITGTTVMEKVREYMDSQKTEAHRRK